MRILNQKNDKALERIIIYLTFSEASELKDSVNSILETKSHHEHIPSDDYQKELTICIYDTDDLSSFDDRSKKLIKDDV
jgi:hypothetical protein